MMNLKYLVILTLLTKLNESKNLLKNSIFYIENNSNERDYSNLTFNTLNSNNNHTLVWLVNNTNAPFCKEPSINEFPNDFVPFKEYHYQSKLFVIYKHQCFVNHLIKKQNKGLVIHSIILVYALIALSIVCDDFFVESLNKISKGLFYILFSL